MTNTRFYVCATLCSILFIYSQLSRADPLSGENVRDAKKKEFPFVAVFRVKDNQGKLKHCTGSLISRRHVLTAAQCVPRRNQSIDSIKLCLGSSSTTACHNYESKTWITYDEWSKKRRFDVNDIAIMTLTSGTNETLDVHPATISAEKKDQMYLKTLRLAGWGGEDSSSTEKDEPVLKTTAVKVMTNKKCELMNYRRNTTSTSAYIREVILCTYADPYAVLDNADMGGPVFDDKGIVGVNVGKEILCLAHHDEETTVNTHMSTDYYRDFINDVITDASDNAVPQLVSNNNTLGNSHGAHNESSDGVPSTPNSNQTELISDHQTTLKINQTTPPEISESSKNELGYHLVFSLVTLSMIVNEIF